MAGTESVREVLAGASEKLRKAAQMEAATHSTDVVRLQCANAYARGVIDLLGAYLADEEVDEIEQLRRFEEGDGSLSTERQRDERGRFAPSEAAQARRDGVAP